MAFVTATNPPCPTLIPPAFGVRGREPTYLDRGSVPHWNAFVGKLEMRTALVGFGTRA